MKPKSATIHRKAIEQYFHVVLFIMLYKVVLTVKSVDETLVCDHSNESKTMSDRPTDAYFGMFATCRIIKGGIFNIAKFPIIVYFRHREISQLRAVCSTSLWQPNTFMARNLRRLS